MLRWSMPTMLMAILALHSAAQDRPAPPLGGPPLIAVARAVEKDGVVLVVFSIPQIMPKFTPDVMEIDGMKTTVMRQTDVFAKWVDAEVPIDGKVVRAFGVDGKSIDPKELPKRLGKTTQVAVVVHQPDAEPKLDLYYLRVLRKDVVVFTGPSTAFSPPVVKK